MRRAYLALHWPAQSETAGDQAGRLAEVMDRAPDWSLAAAAEGMTIWTSADAPLSVTALPGLSGFVIGDAFDAGGRRLDAPHGVRGPAAASEFGRRAAQLASLYWGAYVALLCDPSTDGLGVYRDPTGMLDCLIWGLEPGVTLVASEVTRVPSELRARRAALNWDRIGRFLAIPAAATTPSLLDGIDAVGPGDLLSVAARGRLTAPIWRPSGFARMPCPDPEAAQGELVRRVDLATAALVGGQERVVMELSGGLDSSILAGSIHHLGLHDRVACWLNYSNARPEADERRYARAVTDRMGVALTEVCRTPSRLLESDLAELAAEFWPAMSGVDADRDRDEMARLRETGAEAIVSGQGGDAAFFQMPSPAVAADALRAQGLRLIGSPMLADIARRTRRSVWAVLAEARRLARDPGDMADYVSSLVSRDLRGGVAGVEHPWRQDAREAGLSPGKILHAEAAANLHVNHGVSRRRRVADLLFPLMSQPVLELCLAIPTPALAGGSYDRPYARAAFAHRIPEIVRARRAKGTTSVLVAKFVANSLPFLRPYLLEGCLCDAGYLDRRTLEAALTAERLIWDAKATDILRAVTVEAWVRRWQGRLPDAAGAPRQRR